MNKVLDLQEISKVFRRGAMMSRDKIKAVDRVSLHVNQGEIFGLAGESGCGKTTIARMALGFEEPTSGGITYWGKDGKVASGKKVWRTAGVQAVFQNPFETFNPLRHVEGYFFETVRNFGLASEPEEAMARIKNALHAVGLDYELIRHRYPSEFSGGQLQRISIARALLTDPVLLIADEPVSMVDSSLRMSICNLFRELRDEFGISIIYITHDLATAYYICDRIGVMFRGNLVEMGDAERVLMHPKHPYTELLRDSIPEADPKNRWTTKMDLGEGEDEEYHRVGCKFAGRCPQVMDRCKVEAPKAFDLEGIDVKCFLYGDESKTSNGQTPQTTQAAPNVEAT